MSVSSDSTALELTTGETEFTLTRLFDAPRDLVWAALTEAGHIKQWWGPRGITIPRAEVDLRVGGTQLIVMKAPEVEPHNGREFAQSGHFLVVEPTSKLVYQFDWNEELRAMIKKAHYAPGVEPGHPPVVTILLEDRGAQTLASLTVTYEFTADRDVAMKSGTLDGWKGSLEKLADYLATLQ
ncbi:MAG: SRPBCC domain-containing protein [bacterium]